MTRSTAGLWTTTSSHTGEFTLQLVIPDLNQTDLTNGVQLRSLLVWTVFVCLVPSRLLNKLGGFVSITTVRPTGKMLTERTAASITLTSTPVRWDTWFIHLVIFSFCMSSDVYFTVLLTDKIKVLKKCNQNTLINQLLGNREHLRSLDPWRRKDLHTHHLDLRQDDPDQLDRQGTTLFTLVQFICAVQHHFLSKLKTARVSDLMNESWGHISTETFMTDWK